MNTWIQHNVVHSNYKEKIQKINWFKNYYLLINHMIETSKFILLFLQLHVDNKYV